MGAPAPAWVSEPASAYGAARPRGPPTPSNTPDSTSNPADTPSPGYHPLGDRGVGAGGFAFGGRSAPSNAGSAGSDGDGCSLVGPGGCSLADRGDGSGTVAGRSASRCGRKLASFASVACAERESAPPFA